MKASKQDVENAILYYANHFDNFASYDFLIKSNAALPELVKSIVFEMFVNGIDAYTIFNEESGNAFNILHEYATEIKNNGFVTFLK